MKMGSEREKGGGKRRHRWRKRKIQIRERQRGRAWEKGTLGKMVMEKSYIFHK